MAGYRCLMIGAGGMAGGWIRNFFPSFRDRMTVAGLVDISEEALRWSGDFLELPEHLRFTNQEEAFDKVGADFCCIVTPPAVHELSVRLACERGMDILSEKPIADTWGGCASIYGMVKRAGVRMMITQNYRFTPRILTLEQVIRDGRLGRLNYLMARFAADYRNYGAWGAWRHEIEHSLLIEGSVHHFDQLRNLSGSDCETISGFEWNPEWSSFKHDSSASFVMRFANGIPAHYEGNNSEAGHQTSWHHEYYRAECEGGAVVVDNDDRVWLHEHTPGQGMRLTEVPHVQPPWVGHSAVVCQFLDWLDGGDEPATVLADNIKSAGMLFGAIEASTSGQPVNVAQKVAVVTG